MNRRRHVSLLSLLLSILLIATAAGQTAVDDVVIIVNPSVRQTELSRNTLQAIFGMRMRVWPDGQPIRVIVLADEDPLHSRFCKSVLHVFAHQMRHAWDRGVFSGTSQAPIVAQSERELVELVASTPGAIGYATASSVDDQVVQLDVR